MGVLSGMVWGEGGRGALLHATLAFLAPGVDGLSLEISCLVDIRDHINKELALRFSTDIENKGAFFTDLNGFQVRWGRGRGRGEAQPPSHAWLGWEGCGGPWNLFLCWQIQPRQYLKKLPLQANFYPMPVMAYIQDGQSRLTLHTAQALGVSSLSPGEWSRRG